uniref:Peptidase A1 domain-containing protein n=1 Tax=Moniliophthora roreri TaxID=221103 RepID=A0A0W0FZ18_MONRR
MVLAWKGKGRASDDEIEQWKRDEAEGEANGLGVVLKLDFVGNGVNDQTYTLPIQLGTNQQTVSLQIDTGSSDIWVASTLCSSCGASGNIYNPTVSGTSSNVPFDITYLSGYVQGTIYWDTFNIGGYSIESQALAAATVVNNEPLQSKFNGVLGLALPQNTHKMVLIFLQTFSLFPRNPRLQPLVSYPSPFLGPVPTGYPLS